MLKRLFGKKENAKEQEKATVEPELGEELEEEAEIDEESLAAEALQYDAEEMIEAVTDDCEEAKEVLPVKEKPAKIGFFQRLMEGLEKTRKQFMGKVESLFTGRSVDDEFFEELEEVLIQADVGVKTTLKLVERLQEIVEEERIKETDQLKGIFKQEIGVLLGEASLLTLTEGLNIVMVVGVNGAGKTTTIAKIAERYKRQGKKVLLAAGDTFRAAAIDQLKIWGNRVGIDVIAHSEGADAAAVAFDAIQAARSRKMDLLIIDTAGRLHTHKNLMEELKKVGRIVEKEAGDAHKHTLLVVDATTGQNAITQARLFNEAVKVDGIALTKLDGTAKGGVVIAIKDELKIPIQLIGVGEKADDLQDFRPEEFVQALFAEE